MWPRSKRLNRLEYYRKQRGWSQDDLAKKLRVTPSTISNWENGRHAPPVEAAIKLARVLGCHPAQLFPHQFI